MAWSAVRMSSRPPGPTSASTSSLPRAARRCAPGSRSRATDLPIAMSSSSSRSWRRWPDSRTGWSLMNSQRRHHLGIMRNLAEWQAETDPADTTGRLDRGRRPAPAGGPRLARKMPGGTCVRNNGPVEALARGDDTPEPPAVSSGGTHPPGGPLGGTHPPRPPWRPAEDLQASEGLPGRRGCGGGRPGGGHRTRHRRVRRHHGSVRVGQVHPAARSRRPRARHNRRDLAAGAARGRFVYGRLGRSCAVATSGSCSSSSTCCPT